MLEPADANAVATAPDDAPQPNASDTTTAPITATSATPTPPTPDAPHSRQTPFPWHRVPLLVLALCALIVGLDAATILLGLPAPVTTDRLPEVHGMLMVIGFVGTLIALERAVALRRAAAFLSPILLGVGALLLVTPLPLRTGQLLMVGGSAVLVAIYVPLWQRRPDDAVTVQALGAVLALGATVLWLGELDIARLLPWLVGFVVLTIGGERLELARIHIGANQGARLVALSMLLAGAIIATTFTDLAYPLVGLALLTLGGWLAVRDVARRTIHSQGLPRFTAACLLSGYAWIGVAGSEWMAGGVHIDSPAYDVVVHATFLGFTISMILAHAPVILPAILRRPLPYHPAMLVPAGLLQASLIVRLWLGDGLGWHAAWQMGGLLNVVSLLGFVGVTVWAAQRAKHATHMRRTTHTPHATNAPQTLSQPHPIADRRAQA